MNEQDRQARILDLIEKQGTDGLTPAEEIELDVLQEPRATEAQVEYIRVLLDKLGTDLTDYGYSGADDFDDMTLDDASELIDQLKDDVTDADAWDD